MMLFTHLLPATRPRSSKTIFRALDSGFSSPAGLDLCTDQSGEKRVSREWKGRYKKKGLELGETVLGDVEMKTDDERSIRVCT